MSNHFRLGQRLRDKVSGFEGIATARGDYLSGCVRYCLQPAVNGDTPGELPEGQWFDIEQLEFVDEGVAGIRAEPSGGERANPPARRGL